MRRRPSAEYVFIALLALSSSAFAQKAGVITRFLATANIIQPAPRPGAQQALTPVTLNAAIKWRDTLQTGDNGRIRAQLDDGSILSIGSKSQLVVQRHDAKRQQSELELSYGTVRSQVVHLAAPNSSFE